jgi:hypothetical protein
MLADSVAEASYDIALMVMVTRGLGGGAGTTVAVGGRSASLTIPKLTIDNPGKLISHGVKDWGLSGQMKETLPVMSRFAQAIWTTGTKRVGQFREYSNVIFSQTQQGNTVIATQEGRFITILKNAQSNRWWNLAKPLE